MVVPGTEGSIKISYRVSQWSHYDVCEQDLHTHPTVKSTAVLSCWLAEQSCLRQYSHLWRSGWAVMSASAPSWLISCNQTFDWDMRSRAHGQLAPQRTWRRCLHTVQVHSAENNNQLQEILYSSLLSGCYNNKCNSSQVNEFQRKSYVSQFWKLGDSVPGWGLISYHLILSDHDSSSLGLQEATSSLASYPEAAPLASALKAGSTSVYVLSLSVFSFRLEQFGMFPAHAPSGQLRASLLQSRNIPLSQNHHSHCGQGPSHPSLLLSWALPGVCWESILLTVSDQACFFHCSG